LIFKALLNKIFLIEGVELAFNFIDKTLNYTYYKNEFKNYECYDLIAIFYDYMNQIIAKMNHQA